MEDVDFNQTKDCATQHTTQFGIDRAHWIKHYVMKPITGCST